MYVYCIYIVAASFIGRGNWNTKYTKMRNETQRNETKFTIMQNEMK